MIEKDLYDEAVIASRSSESSEQYTDGRGTYLYTEIHYTKSSILGTFYTNYDMTYIYCNSSGSTLTSYSITYGQTGFTGATSSLTGTHVTQCDTVDINTTTKTFETYPSYVPVMDGESVLQGYVGVTQNYNCRGYENSFTHNLIPN